MLTVNTRNTVIGILAIIEISVVQYTLDLRSVISSPCRGGIPSLMERCGYLVQRHTSVSFESMKNWGPDIVHSGVLGVLEQETTIRSCDCSFNYLNDRLYTIVIDYHIHIKTCKILSNDI